MSEKRRDKKKRILRNGESQRKDGRYAYKYYDNAGNVQFVYSWKLEKGDRLPAGKRDDLALREKEREIKQRLEAELIPQGGEITVLELVQKYISFEPPQIMKSIRSSCGDLPGAQDRLVALMLALGPPNSFQQNLSNISGWISTLEPQLRYRIVPTLIAAGKNEHFTAYCTTFTLFT